VKKRKTILIGLDGCDFQILKPLIAEGHLPTFSDILDQGTHGILMSTTPPNSAPAWTSILTGVNPGKHGVIDFFIKTEDGFKFTGGRRRVDSLWTLLDRFGIKQIIVNDPISYPPEKLNGIMLTGFMTPPGSKNFLYPERLREEINQACGGYQPELDLDWENVISLDKNGAYDVITEFAEKDKKAALYLAKNHEWDLFSVTFTSTDRLQHFYFDDKQRIKLHYELLDGMINNILSIETDANIFLMSDHGFGPLNKCFYINTWLQKQGTLSESKSIVNRVLSKFGLTYKRIVALLTKIKIYQFVARLMPSSIKMEIPISPGESNVDLMKSQAFLKTINGGLYVDGSVSLSKIVSLLNAIKINGENPIDGIRRKDEVWWGPYAKYAPDIALTPKYGYEISPKLAPSVLEKPLKYSDIRTGTHRPEGIFMACGPDIKKNYQVEQYIQTWDIVPTVLHMMNLPVPSYMDGKPMQKIFKEDSEPAIRPVMISP